MDTDEKISKYLEHNVSSMLPFGPMLRPLLNDSYLSDADLNNVLKSRGVFVGSSEKKNTIPTLMTMVLSPKEFELLQDKQATKESHPKHRNSTIKSTSKKPLTTFINDFSINTDEIEKLNPDISLNSPMNFSYISNNHVLLEYSIIRKDLTRDWVRPLSSHSGKIIVEKNEAKGEIQITNEYTSKETDDINKMVMRNIVNHMKLKGEVKDDLETINASDFTNRERFNFILSLANDSEDGSLEFLEIKDVEIGPDPDNPPNNPDSIIQENVKKIIINGTALEKNVLLTNDSLKDNLILRSIEVKYNFNYQGTKGHCILQFGFMHFFRNQNTSQEFQVALPYLHSKSGNKNILKSFVLRSFETLKRKKYDEVKASKSSNN